MLPTLPALPCPPFARLSLLAFPPPPHDTRRALPPLPDDVRGGASSWLHKGDGLDLTGPGWVGPGLAFALDELWAELSQCWADPGQAGSGMFGMGRS